MTKWTPGLPQRPRGFWPTPFEAVKPLIPFLPAQAVYAEPCAGDGALIRHLSNLWLGGSCGHACDLVPNGVGVVVGDAREVTYRPEFFITNPPWPVVGGRGEPALSILQHLCGIARTWALLPWDFAANDYFSRISAACVQIVPIGRVSWLNNGKGGKDNAAWYLFDRQNRVPTVVWPRP